MAFITQETKKKIAAELKKIMPSDWKYSLSVRDHCALVLTISEAPVDLFALAKNEKKHNGHIQINHYYLNDVYEGEILDVFQKANKVLNMFNYDKSNSHTDFYDVGYFVNINIGRWNKPFKVIH